MKQLRPLYTIIKMVQPPCLLRFSITYFSFIRKITLPTVGLPSNNNGTLIDNFVNYYKLLLALILGPVSQKFVRTIFALRSR